MAIIHVDESNFEELVLKASGKVVVDFWATWCGPCMMLSPVLEEISVEHPDLTIAKIDVDEVPALAMRYRVNSIPTVMVFENGTVTGGFMGYRPKNAVVSALGL